jgi:hypothetical protein
LTVFAIYFLLFPKIGDALILFYFALPLSQFRGMIEENQIGLQLELEIEAPLNNFFSKLLRKLEIT